MSLGGYNKTHNAIEETRRIDIRHLQNENFFKLGRKLKGRITYNIEWTNMSGKYGSCVVEYKDSNCLEIIYTIKREDIRQSIQLDYIKTNFGERAYFVCPDCDRKITTLCFAGLFKCRICSSLNYKSSQANHDILTKPDKKIETILKKLKHKNDNINDLYYVPKPKRMRYATYERLINQLHYWQDIRNMAICESLKRFIRDTYRNFGIKPDKESIDEATL